MPEIPDSPNNKIRDAINKISKQNISSSKEKKGLTKVPAVNNIEGDSIHISPMHQWMQTLRAMPEVSHSQEELDAIRRFHENEVDDALLESEIYPAIEENIAQDLGILLMDIADIKDGNS